MKTALTIIVCMILSMLFGSITCYCVTMSNMKWAKRFRAWGINHVNTATFIIILQLMITGLVFGVMLWALLPVTWA